MILTLLFLSTIFFLPSKGETSPLPKPYSYPHNVIELNPEEIEVIPSSPNAVLEKLQSRCPTLRSFRVDGCDVYLLGTSHISKKSCEDATFLMNVLDPDCLFIELCPQRIPILLPPPTIPSLNETDSVKTQIASIQNQTGMSYLSALSVVMLTKVQSDYAEKLNIQVGAEFREAFIKRKEGCRVILGDRPVNVSLVRAWESLNVWYKFKLVMCLLWSCIKQPSEQEILEWMEQILKDQNGDILTKSIQLLSKHFPSIGTVIIQERDLYMYVKLRQAIRTTGCRRLFAVVGAGHCPGITTLLERDLGRMMPNKELEDLLRRIVETKKWRAEKNEEVRALITDVIELNEVPDE